MIKLTKHLLREHNCDDCFWKARKLAKGEPANYFCRLKELRPKINVCEHWAIR